MRNKAVTFVLSWLIFNILLTVALLVNRFIYFESYMEEAFSLELTLEIFAQIILLTVTGFIIFGFLKVVLRDWFRKKENSGMFLIPIFYLSILASYLITYTMAFGNLPREVIIDAPLMIAAATLVMGIIPFFKNNFFSAIQ